MVVPSYENCNDRDKNQAEKVYNEVRLLLGKASLAIISLQKYQPGQRYEPKDQMEADRFALWFGPAIPENYETVRNNVIYPMVLQLERNPVTIECGGANCNRRVYAYVTAAGAGITINLCQKFFTAPLYGTDSQVGTLLHEITHLVGNTQDYKYDWEAAKALAENNPADAMNNADNYEYYLESFH